MVKQPLNLITQHVHKRVMRLHRFAQSAACAVQQHVSKERREGRMAAATGTIAAVSQLAGRQVLSAGKTLENVPDKLPNNTVTKNKLRNLALEPSTNNSVFKSRKGHSRGA